jgi:tetratricopeptide (TPR) repeat protein
MRLVLILIVSGATTAASRAQSFFPLPPVHPHTQLSDKQVQERDALKKFGLALLCIREDRLIEGVKALEEAAKLDPNAPAILREQVTVYLALERLHDALAAAEKLTQFDADNAESWFMASRLYRTAGRLKDHRFALEKGLALPHFKEEHPQVAQQMYLDLGAVLESEEDLAGAVKAYTAAARILDNPEPIMENTPLSREQITARASEVYERIGGIERRQKRYTQAIAAYEAAQARARDGHGRLSFNLAQLCKEQGDLDKALAHVDRYLTTVPLGVEAHELKIDVLTRLNRQNEVLPWLEKIALIDVHNIPLRHLLARTYLQHDKFRDAEHVFNKLAADAPSEEVYRGLFKIYERRGTGITELFGILQKTIELAKKRPPQPGTALAGEQAQAMFNVLRQDGPLAKAVVVHAFKAAQKNTAISYETLRILAILADKHRQFAESERFYLELLKDPGQRTEPAVYGGYLRTLWRNRKYADIVRVCDDCLKNDTLITNRLLFTTDKARALAALERMDEALAMADEAIKTAQDDNLLYTHQLRIRLLSQADRHEQAEKECKALFKKFTTLEAEQDLRYLLSGVYNAAGKKKESENELLEILKLDPNSTSANNDLGYLWADQNRNLAEAEAMIRKAIENDRSQRKVFGADQGEDNAAYIDSLGWVLFRKGDFEGARKELEKAVSLPDGDDPVLWDHLGDVYFRLRMPAQAQAAWEKSVQLYEQDRRRKMDERYREVKDKIRLVKNGGKAPPMGN